MSQYNNELSALWARQKRQQQNLATSHAQLDTEQLVKEYVMAMIDEVMGIIRCTNFKLHHLSRQPFIRGNMLEELVDAFKYILSIALLYDITPEEFFEQFMAKSDRVDARWLAEQMVLQEGTKIIGIDLDGCVADYVTGFRDYVRQQGYTMRTSVPLAYNFAEAFDIDQHTLEQLKEAFEESGGFITLPIYPRAAEILRKLQRLGYKIVIITSRRQTRAHRIFYDTSEWLKTYGIPYDMLLFSRDKSDALRRNIYPAKCLFFVEDHDKYAFELASDGTPVLLLEQPYNGNLKHPNIARVQDWDEIYRTITADIRMLLEE